MTKRINRFITIITVLMLLLSFPVYAEGLPAAVSVTIDGQPVMFPDAQPYIVNGRTMIPIRFISENMGGKVSWEQSTKTVTLKQGSITIVLEIGKTSAAVVDSSTSKRGTKIFDAAPVIKDSRTFVPLRFVSETMGCGVSWDNNTKTVAIRTDGVMTEKLGKSDINVSVNGKSVVFEDAKPVLKASDIFVPVRAVVNRLVTAEISLNSSTDDITVTFNDNKLQFISGMKAVFVNGQAYSINDAIFIENNRLMVPLKFMAEKLGFTYKWNAATNTAELTADYTQVSKDNTIPQTSDKFVPYLPELTPMDAATKAELMKYPENVKVKDNDPRFYFSNAEMIKAFGMQRVVELAQIAKGLEETIYNADYRTVDENYVKQLKFFYTPGMSKNEETLGPWAERYAKDIIKYKIIVKGEYITDSVFVYKSPDNYRIRGRLKFKFISASKEFFDKYKQPEFKLNTWYYQDMEICLSQQFSLGKANWEHAIYTFSGEVDHSDYIEVK